MPKGIYLRTKIGGMSGKYHSEETRKKMSIAKQRRKGKDNPNWKGGKKRNTAGYILIYSINHPYKKKDNCVMEHRLVIEKNIGRYLKKEEFIHHINENKQDNRIENLQIVSREEHRKIHSLSKINNKISLGGDQFDIS